MYRNVNKCILSLIILYSCVLIGPGRSGKLKFLKTPATITLVNLPFLLSFFSLRVSRGPTPALPILILSTTLRRVVQMVMITIGTFTPSMNARIMAMIGWVMPLISSLAWKI